MNCRLRTHDSMSLKRYADAPEFSSFSCMSHAFVVIWYKCSNVFLGDRYEGINGPPERCTVAHMGILESAQTPV